jgi:hypothetical protein
VAGTDVVEDDVDVGADALGLEVVVALQLGPPKRLGALGLLKTGRRRRRGAERTTRSGKSSPRNALRVASHFSRT